LPSKTSFTAAFAIVFIILGISSSAALLPIDNGRTPVVHVKSKGYGDPWGELWLGEKQDSFRSSGATIGAVYAAGFTDGLGVGLTDVLIVRYSTEGLQMWNRSWGTSFGEEGAGLVVTTDHLYVAGRTVTGSSGLNGLLVKFNLAGTEVWNVSWGGGANDEFVDIALGSDGIYVTGSTGSYGAGGSDAVIVKYDFDGNLLWQETWGVSEDEFGASIAVTSDSVYLTGRDSCFCGGPSNGFLARFSTSGVQAWNTTWGGTYYDEGYGVAVHNESVYITGPTASKTSSTSDLILLKYNSTGVQQWNWTYHYNQESTDSGYSLVATAEDVYATGRSSWASQPTIVTLINLNADGVLQWNTSWGGDGDCVTQHLAQAVDGLYISGETEGWLVGGRDGFLAKFDFDGAGSPGPITLANPGEIDTDGSIPMSWTEPFNPSESVAGYELQMDNSPLFLWPDVPWSTAQPSYTVTLETEGTYYFRVRPYNSGGLYGPWSNIQNITVQFHIFPPIDPWLAPLILIVSAVVLALITIILFVYRRLR
jgi:hypothetical protein